MIIAIPLYRAPELIAGLFEALIALAAEIADIDGGILLINDSIDDSGLRAELDARLPNLARAIPTEIIENADNLGFVRSANRALSRGRETGEDVILLNSDALPTAGAFKEMAEVAYLDPMTVVVSPRSNNATICNSPYPEHFRGRDPIASRRDHDAIARRLPRFSYVPTAVGFCLYIRAFALREFGLFDEIYGQGYNEENDFIRRCNRRGYRAVLANRAFVSHLGNASFAQSTTFGDGIDIANRRTLDRRYPEYDTIVRRFYSGAQYRTEYLASGLIPDARGRLRLMFDCRLLGAHHNGTSELTVQLLNAFATAFESDFDIAVLCDPENYVFHGMDTVSGLRRCDVREAREWPFAVAFRIGQPFTPEDLSLPFDAAPIAGFLMLDTIALDCQQLDTNDLEQRWRTCAAEANVLAYISSFSRDQFRRRFAVHAGAIETVALCSTDIAEYPPLVTTPPARMSPRTILVVGNHYPHKAIGETVDLLRSMGGDDIRIVVLGGTTQDVNAESHAAGGLTPEAVDGLFATADVVLFPSHYEGFGLPIMHALAHRKPVVARRRPAAIEIGERTPQAANLHLGETLDDLVAAALAFPQWTDSPAATAAPPQTWDAAARAIGTAIKRAIACYNYSFSLGRQTRLGASGSQARLRGLPIAATAPAARQTRCARPDFDEITALLDAYHRRGDAGWLDRLFGRTDAIGTVMSRLDDACDASLGSIERLNLVVPASAGAHAIQPDLQKWVQRIAAGGRLELRIEEPNYIDTEFGLPGIDAILVLLANAGCAPLSRFRDGSTIGAVAVKLFDWRDALDHPGSNRDFVEHCYLRILGREGDSAGVEHHASLADQNGRPFIANAFYLSQERIARVRSCLTEYFSG